MLPVQRYPISLLLVSPSLNLGWFCYRASYFRVSGILTQVDKSGARMTLNDTRSDISPICFTNVLTFSNFYYTESRFWVKGQFETCAPNHSKMTLNTTRSKVPHTCFTNIEVSNFNYFFLYSQTVWDHFKIPMKTVTENFKKSWF